MKKIIIFIMWCVVVLVSACRKDVVQADPAQNDRDTSRLIKLCLELSAILQHVYEDRQAYREVNAAIYSGYYEDERVLLIDLLNPGTSVLYTTGGFKRHGAETGRFRKVFTEIVSRGNYPLTRIHLWPSGSGGANRSDFAAGDSIRSDNSVLNTEELAIYFPYSEHHLKAGPGGDLSGLFPATIVFANQEGNRAPGKQPFACGTVVDNICYRDVIVDDEYAAKQPVHIVTTGAETAGPAAIAASATPPVTRVFQGWGRLSVQMDRLISFTGNGGGSEVKIGRINAFLRLSDQQVTSFSGDLVTVYFKRAEIAGRQWKRIYSIWDPNWNYQDIEQIYAVYEDDTQGQRTFTGSLSTTLKIPGIPSPGNVQGELGFKISVSTQDEILTQRKLDRKSFLADGLNNQGWGFMRDNSDFLDYGRDWPIVDGGTAWSYTMAWRAY